MGFSRKSGGWRGGQEQELVGSPEGVDTSGLSLGTPGRTGCSLMGSGLPGYHAGAEGEGSRDPGALDPRNTTREPRVRGLETRQEGPGLPGQPASIQSVHTRRFSHVNKAAGRACRAQRWAPCSPTSGPSRPSNVICLNSWDFIHRRCLKQESTCDMQG